MRNASKKTIRTYLFVGGIGLFVLSFLTASWIVLFTQAGSSFFIKKIVAAIPAPHRIIWKKNSGTLAGGMSYQDMNLTDLPWLPVPNTLKIQLLSVSINSAGWRGVSLRVENARLQLPDSEPVLVQGTLEHGRLDVNVYAPAFSSRELEAVLKRGLGGVTGTLRNVDVYVRGTVDEPVFTGNCVVEKIRKDDFFFEEGPCTFDITLRTQDGERGIYGPVVFSGGTAKGKKTATLRVQHGKIVFRGDPLRPDCDVEATSTVEKIKIKISVAGEIKDPTLQVSSDPVLPKEKIVLALATNKFWNSSDALLSGGTVSPELVRDVIDYFLFGSLGDKLAEKLGVSAVSVTYNEQGKGVAVTKNLSPKLEGTYEIEQKNRQNDPPDITQTIGGVYNVTNSISLEAKKELLPLAEERRTESGKKPDDSVELKFKKTF